MERKGYMYILASRKYGTLYTGVTSDIIRRVWEHKHDVAEGFTKKYGIKTLVYFECYDEITQAIAREKHLKDWKRDWKINLIEQHNPHWQDMYPSLLD